MQACCRVRPPFRPTPPPKIFGSARIQWPNTAGTGHGHPWLNYCSKIMFCANLKWFVNEAVLVTKEIVNVSASGEWSRDAAGGTNSKFVLPYHFLKRAAAPGSVRTVCEKIDKRGGEIVDCRRHFLENIFVAERSHACSLSSFHYYMLLSCYHAPHPSS